MEVNITLPYKFKPYPPQARAMQAIANGYKRIILPWSRRQGKDLFAINALTIEAMKVVGTYFYMFPTGEQARKAIFEGFTNDGRRIISYIPEAIIKKIRLTKLQIELVNGSIIEFVGSDDASKGLAGTNVRGVIFSEAGLSQEEGWTVGVKPIIMGNNGWVLFISTFRGENWFLNLADFAVYHPSWYHERLNVVDSGSMQPKEILSELLSCDNNGFKKVRQELFNRILNFVDTCYYEEELKTLKREGKISESIKYDPRYPIHTSWDIGVVDKTAVWFFQLIEETGNYRFLHYYESINVDIGTDIRAITEIVGDRKLGYHFFPHDGGRRQKSDLRDLRMIAEEDHDLMNVEVVKRPTDKNITIEGLRRIFPKLEFDNSDLGIKEGLEHVGEYHEKVVKNRATGEEIRQGKPDHKGSDPVNGLFSFSIAEETELIDNDIPDDNWILDMPKFAETKRSSKGSYAKF